MSSKRGMRYDDFIWGKILGEGSYSEVVMATMKEEAKAEFQSSPKTKVYAIKRLSIQFLNREDMIKERTGRDVFKQVHTEKTILIKLRSDFIVTLFGTFRTNDEIFFVLSYMDKGDLRDVLNEKAALEVSTTQFYAAEIFSALFYLHDNDIIHRDMKPENVLLHEYINGIHLKLCDFATAKDLTTLEEGKKPSTFVGSAEYVSPELLGANKEVGKYTCFESDIWAAGCITYFMLSGLPPFQAQSEYLVFRKIENVTYSFPTGFHEKGRKFVEAVLELEPKDRLGHNRNHDAIKSCEFFSGINFDNLYSQTPPPIEQYFAPSDESDKQLTLGQLSINDDCPRSEVNDESGQGIPFYLSSEEYDQLLRDQKINRKNIAHRWKDFVDNELILKMGYMEKKRGLFPRKRMFLLTGGKKEILPRLVYVDANEWTKKGQINFHQEVTLEQKTFSRFYIIDPNKGRTGRIYDLTDKNSNVDINAGAVQWLKKLKKLQNLYFM